MMGNQEITWLLQEKYHGVRSANFLSDCARLENSEPLGYIIGQVPFLHCTITLNSRPLIPRTETEYWVEQALKVIDAAEAAQETPVRILDLCAGSGAIGIAVAAATATTHITFGEIEARHLPTITENREHNHIDPKRTHIIASDLFANITGTYDFILTNPPYIDPSIDRTEWSVKNFEPHTALYGGQAGMEIISRIIREAPGYLSAQGQLWMEHEPEQIPAITTLAGEAFTMVTHPDQYKIPRFSILTMAQY